MKKVKVKEDVELCKNIKGYLDGELQRDGITGRQGVGRGGSGGRDRVSQTCTHGKNQAGTERRQ